MTSITTNDCIRNALLSRVNDIKEQHRIQKSSTASYMAAELYRRVMERAHVFDTDHLCKVSEALTDFMKNDEEIYEAFLHGSDLPQPID